MSRIEDLKNQIREIERQQLQCNHQYGPAMYDPEKKMEGYGWTGYSQAHGNYEGYREKLVPRWSKTCEKCEHKLYTYDQEPIITGYKPKF